MMRDKSYPNPRRRPSMRGFTLIELMITVLVLAILSVIAIPIYEHQIAESRRTDARTAVLELAAREERYYATNNAYTDIPADLGYGTAQSPVQWPVTVGSGYYEVTATVPDPNIAAPSFLITAVPVPGGTQAQEDTSCASFTVDSTGAQAATDSSGSSSTSTCW